MKNILTFDIEDWFHILDLPSENSHVRWEQYESRVDTNTRKILRLLDRFKTKATFFVLGWIAERHPDLVKTIHARGHEVASHGYGHELLYDLTPEQLREDLLKSRQILKNITGEYPVSYRAPGFSITPQNQWAMDIIAECGFSYDASIYPGRHGHGGHPAFSSKPTKLSFASNGRSIIEMPVTVSKILGKKMCFSGGGYLRLLPYFLIEKLMQQCQTTGKPVVVYLHPREIDTRGLQLDMPLKRKFKCYINIKSTERKLTKLLAAYSFGSLCGFFNDNKEFESIEL